ncbi:LuxR C-terminal-related transcriptional regulator [uncultured Williamsia sp.]|uniref:LuxR C-terminal-related transcriptional regulator n=1 Tax=uncultured Williamsia sp. TaxID=259311 RepID=UPI00261813BB|nr:LuxR C-terminal-related transcriptional regulator [uncultured Williamsia sp.]
MPVVSPYVRLSSAAPAHTHPTRRPSALRVVPAPPAPPAPPAVERPSLSRREVEVLLAWLAAESKAEAAAALYITASTVNTHLTRIRAKYTAVGRPARSKANLFARAIQDGYTRLDEW